MSATPNRPQTWRIAGIAFAHASVDLFSFIIIPLLSVLEGRLKLTGSQGAILIAVGSIASGAVQPATALLGDRHDTRWIGVLGMLLLVVSASLVGYAHNYWQILGLQVLASMGSGAFHPPAAAVMGHLSGPRRGLGMGVFFAAGMMGGIAGNTLSPAWVRQFGVPSILWWIVPGMAMTALAGMVMLSSPQRHADAHQNHAAKSADERRESWVAVGVLYAGNVLRFLVNMMLVQLLVRWSEMQALRRSGTPELDPISRTLAAQINGPMQAAMQIGMGITGLLLGALIARRWEKPVLIGAPIAGAAAIAAFPFAPASSAFMLAIFAGAAYAGVVPITLSMAQRLLPHRTGLASGLMLGGAWSLAALGPPLAQHLLDAHGERSAFLISAALLGVSGLLSCRLPSHRP